MGQPDFTKVSKAPDTDKRLDELLKVQIEQGKRQGRLDKKFLITTAIAVGSLIVALIALLMRR